MMNNVMIDIETFGNVNNSVIVSIGAIKFDIESGEIGEEFYTKVDIDSCLEKGFEVTGSTLKWWLCQNEEARKEIAKGDGVNIEKALEYLSFFINKNDIVWSNGLRFDIAILDSAFKKIGLNTPWEFRNERDVRTLVAFYPKIKQEVLKSWKGNTHLAINDCKIQIDYCSKIYQKLKI